MRAFWAHPYLLRKNAFLSVIRRILQWIHEVLADVDILKRARSFFSAALNTILPAVWIIGFVVISTVVQLALLVRSFP